MPQHKIQTSITSSSGITSITGYDIEAPNSEFSNQPTGQSFAANSVNSVLSGFTFNAAKLQSCEIVATGNCLLQTWGTVNGNTNLVGSNPLAWGVSPGYFANPFGNGNINSGTITCNAAVQVKFILGSN